MKLSLTKLSRLGRFFLALKPQYVAVVGVITLFLAIIYMLPGDRSFLIDAKTLGLNIEFVEDASINTWRLAEGAVLCRLAENSASASNDEASGVCPHAEFDVEVLQDSLGLTWPGGVRLDVFATLDGGLALMVVDLNSGDAVELGRDLRPLDIDDIIVLPRKTFMETGSLPFAADLQVGTEASAGARTLLVSGEYVIREQLVGRSRLIEVATGTLHRGDRVSFVNDDKRKPVTSFGFFASEPVSPPGQGQAPFALIAYTEMALSQMIIDRYGAQRSTMTSDWTQRAVNDPLLIGGTVFLTLVSLFISILSSLIKNAQVLNAETDVTPEPSIADPVIDAAGEAELNQRADTTKRMVRSVVAES